MRSVDSVAQVSTIGVLFPHGKIFADTLQYGREAVYRIPQLREGFAAGRTCGQFIGALSQSHYEWIVDATQVIGGALMLSNRYVPLGLAILAPVIVNIDAFHIFMAPNQAALVILFTLCWCIVFTPVRQHFSCLLMQRT